MINPLPLLLTIHTMFTNQIHVGNMIVQWNSKDDRVFFEIFAPTKGWVALGFNTDNNIVDANLIMGAFFENKSRVEDQYVSANGVHKRIEEFLGQSQIDHTTCIENDVGTILKFSIPQQSADKYHKSFIEGKDIWFICAYSAEDDFSHHSISREHVKIKFTF